MTVILKNVRLFRQQNGWSQRELALRLQISISAVSKIEKGIADISISKVQQLSEAFDIPPYKLFGYPESEVEIAQVNELRQKLAKMEADILILQQKAMDLYEELLSSRRYRR